MVDKLKFEQLVDFIRKEMRMSHVYQPLLIRALVDSGGYATVRQLARAFLVEDESQLVFYERVIRRMPAHVLQKHGVVSIDMLAGGGEILSLNTEKLSFEQENAIRQACNERLNEFLNDRGLGTWDSRLLDRDPVPDSLRFMVLKESGGRCALCGATKHERPLDVDHIVPRSRWHPSLGNVNDMSNLQVLCSKCNRSKRNQDTTDFRGPAAPEIEPGCPFCDARFRARACGESGLVFAVTDGFPVTPGHMLIIPKRHIADFFSLTENERGEAMDLVKLLRNRLVENDRRIVGFNFGVNSGEAAGQTVMHCHLHLIPRRTGDMADPRGGVRGVIPEKMKYSQPGRRD